MPSKAQESSISESDRTLRIISIITFIPAIAILIPHGVLSDHPCPAIGLIPMSLSAAYGIVLINKTIKSQSIDTFIDAFLAVFLIGILVPTLIDLSPRRWYYGGDARILGAFGTMPLLINMCIHIYFASRKLANMLLMSMAARIAARAECPHCHRTPGRPNVNWRTASRDDAVHDMEEGERYRDEPETAMGEDVDSVHSGSMGRQVKAKKVAPLFHQTPPPEEEEDSAVVV